MKAFALLCILSVISTAFGACLVGTASKKENANCAWYNDNSCCDSAVADAAVNTDSTCKLETGCKDQVNLLLCGLSCSPDISEAISGTSINVCSSFADKLYSSCKSSELETAGGCKKVGDEYSDAKAMATAMGLTYDESDSSPKCFNAGSLAQPIFAMVVVAIAALLKL